MDDDTHRAIERGLAYLRSRQNADGSLGRGGYAMNVAVVALAGMAYMSRGDTPGRGPYGEGARLCLDYILAHTEASGFVNSPAFTGPGPMYGHGFATLFLAEAYGMTDDNRIRDRLSHAVKLIIATQNDEGGWRYFPRRADADLSVTICQVMALRAARNAGIFVPNDTIDRCIAYVKRCQNDDGGFMYQTTQPGISEFPRSAAGVVALYSAGIYEGEAVEKGLRYLLDAAPQHYSPSGNTYYFYGQYYAAQAMYLAGDAYWTKWYPAIRDPLKQAQRPTGEWPDPICAEYGTAMACIILQMPNSHLPIFQR
ncbi:MAG: terpene cyclase/mutase family protein [Planctomycetes bacterium]|nr:terpene cyclase/mutase family protein [Planctomycetota bacterium]